MATQVQICNLALSRIGQRTIAAISDSSENARKLTAVYDYILESVLRDCDWNFATKIEALVAVDDEDDLEIEWDYVYEYPSDCIKVRRVFSESTYDEEEPDQFRVVLNDDDDAKLIVCDLDDAYVEYTLNITDPTLYDSKFVDALAWRLAAEITPSLTGDKKSGADLMGEYYRVISEAQRINYSENYHPKPKTSTFIDAR